MNYIQWPWEIITINDGKNHSVLRRHKQQNSENPMSIQTYQETGRADTNAPRSSAQRPSSSSYFPTSGTGSRPDIAENLGPIVGTFLDASETVNSSAAPHWQHQPNGAQHAANPENLGAINVNNEHVGTSSHILNDTGRRPTEQKTSDILASVINSMNRIEDCLKVLIHQYRQQDEPPQATDAEDRISAIPESAINADDSLDRLRDIIGDHELSILERRSSASSLGQSDPDVGSSPVPPRIPLVNAVYTAERMARERGDNSHPTIDRRPGSAPPPSDFGSHFPYPSYDRRSPRTFHAPQGQSHDRPSSHVPSVEPAVINLCETTQGFDLEHDAAGSRNSARIDIPTISYYSPDPIMNATLENVTLQGEGVITTPLSPHSLLNTPAPRIRVGGTSTPVMFSGSALPTDFLSAHDFGHDTAQQSHWDRPASRRSTNVPHFPAPGTFDSMMQMLRDIHSTQLAAIEQQQENMLYMRALSEWLGRDVRDRQTEIRGMAENFNQLRDYVYRLGSGPSFIYPGLQPFGMAANPSLPRP